MLKKLVGEANEVGSSGEKLNETELQFFFEASPLLMGAGYSQALVENGIDGVELLRKPYTFEDLIERFRRVLRDAKC